MGDEDEKHASSKAILTDPEEYCPGTWNLEPGTCWNLGPKLKCPGASKVGSWEAAARRTQHSALSSTLLSALSTQQYPRLQVSPQTSQSSQGKWYVCEDIPNSDPAIDIISMVQ